MARKLFPYIMLVIAGGIILFVMVNKLQSRFTTLDEVADFTAAATPAPVATPEPTPEPTPTPTPTPEPSGPSLEALLNRVQGKLGHFGQVTGRLANQKYFSKMYVQRDPCVAQVHSKWEIMSEESMQIGNATFDLPFGLLRDPVSETLQTGNKAVCRIKLRQQKNYRFRLNEKRMRIVSLYLASETACREMAEELKQIRELCGPK